MARILRGEIWWADLDPVRGREQAGTRPVLIISHDVFNEHSGTVIALAITSQKPSSSYPLALPGGASYPPSPNTSRSAARAAK